MSVRLEPQNENIPDEVLIRAQRFGQDGLVLNVQQDWMALAYGTGLYIFKSNLWNGINTVKILALVGDYFCHPRSGALKSLPYWNVQADVSYLTGIYGGGYYKDDKDVWKEIANRYMYPIVDDDHGTFAINMEDKSCDWSGTSDDNYGNIWWTSTEGKTFSWKGPPNRHFPLAAYLNIPGLTYQLPNSNLFTCFTNNIYQDGNVYHSFEPELINSIQDYVYVLGAWTFKDIVFCVVALYYSPSATLSTEVRRQDSDKWVLVNGGSKELQSGLSVPAFIDLSGEFFTIEDRLFQLEVSEKDVTSKDITTKYDNRQADTEGKYTVSGTDPFQLSFNYADAALLYQWSEPKSDKLSFTNIQHSAFHKTETRGSSNVTAYDLPVYRANPASDFYIETFFRSVGCDISCNSGKTLLNFHAVPNGSYCDITWSGANCSYQEYAQACANNCEVFTVSATILPQGLTRSLEVYVPGSWSNDGAANECTCSYIAANTAYQYSSNKVRYEVTWAVSDWPIDLVIKTDSDILATCTPTTITCSGCTGSANYSGYIQPVGFADWYYNFDDAIGQIIVDSYTNTNCTSSSPPQRLRGYSWATSPGNRGLVFNSSGDYFCASVVRCGGICTQYYEYSTFHRTGSICNTWLSDSWKTSLVDSNGNPVIVPNDNGSYLYKVAKVQKQICV